MPEFTHFDERGASRMVDVTHKEPTNREAIARGVVFAAPETLAKIAKRTSELIPLCHPLNLSGVDLDLSVDHDRGCVLIESHVRVTAQTGVEMEALTAVSVAGLTVYDMCKSVDRGMVIGEIRLIRKTGGKSGDFVRDEPS